MITVNPRFSADAYLSKMFNMQEYNCWDFAADVWADITGVRLHAFIEDFSITALNEVAEYKASQLQRLPGAVSPSIVLMQRRLRNPHVGVYINDRVLHLRESGVENTSLKIATLGYSTVTFYQ